MIRTIIKIDKDKCIGCGLCVNTCHESALAIVDGKATLLKDDYCDGLGRCMPKCPVGALSFDEREALPYDKEAVKANKESMKKKEEKESDIKSNLNQWPVQIKLVPVDAPYFDGANLLIAADCTAFSYGNFHNRFMKDKITLIGCPKLDEVDYADKLTEILKTNDINSIAITRMEVPCCSGIVNAVKKALKNSGKVIPWRVTTISTEGEIIEEL